MLENYKQMGMKTMARDLTKEPLLPVTDIQGDILVGLTKRCERLIFFKIENPAEFKRFVAGLAITTMADTLSRLQLIQQRKRDGVETLVPTPGLNVAFTYQGLSLMQVQGLGTATGIAAFKAGMAQRKSILNDPPQDTWQIMQSGADVHGVFILAGASPAEIADIISLQLAPAPGNGWRVVDEQFGQVRPDPVKGHEHFGFADGVSQPGIRGVLPDGTALTPSNSADENQGGPGQDLLWPGEFVFGYPGQDAKAAEFFIKGPDVSPPVAFMKNGAFLVFRRLAQHVPEFHATVKAAAASVAEAPDAPSADLLAAQMVGRWKSGAPVIKAPTADNPALAEGTKNVNDFEFTDDREGLLCPWGAHVRKVYPRNDVRHNTKPTETEISQAEAFTQTHRMLRRGIAFGPELTEREAKSGHSDQALTRGLLFKCYVTSIEDQFEFVQQQWVDAADFSQPNSGVDPIIGQSPNPSKPFTGAAPFSKNAANKPKFTFPQFVQMQGGGYFFAPSISALKSLAV